MDLSIQPKTISIHSSDEAPTATSPSSPSNMPESLPCDLTVKISIGLHLDPFNKNSSLQAATNIIDNQSNENERIEQIVKRNLVTFSQLTNLDVLYPHLISTSLLSRNDYEQLEGIKSINGKMNFLYIFLLPKKGRLHTKLFSSVEGGGYSLWA